MTVQELKEEFKQSEGNPEIKAKIKQMRRQKRPAAHDGECAEGLGRHHQPDPLAVALRYEPGMAAPVCLAKGMDASRCAFARSPASTTSRSSRTRLWPARCMPPSRSTGNPGEHYKAVAEVISYVIRLKRRQAMSG